MEYRVFPPIGIARIGNSPSFYVGPEVVGSLGREIGGAHDTEVVEFKDSQFRVKKMAARFHLFQRALPTDQFEPAVLPAGATIRWSVQVANKKDGINRPTLPPLNIPAAGIRPVLNAARANRVINSGQVQIVGPSAAAQKLQGTHVGVPVTLGELRTDNQGRLLVIGADGISLSEPASSIGPDFYNNVNWHDDVADGPVSAEVVHGDGSVETAVGAWVVVGPPDFAPGANCIVTLYDVILQMSVTKGWRPAPTVTSFTQDIFPLLKRARSLRWAHGKLDQATGAAVGEVNWNNISEDFTRLANPIASEQGFRTTQKGLTQAVEGLLSQYRLTNIQKDHLNRWANGTFSPDWTGVPPLSTIFAPDVLLQATLERTSGQGFFPGIEGGRILIDPSIYSQPFDFRINPGVLKPGDVTALMAQPWQADFLKCNEVWWPSQRPDIAPQSNGTLKMWARLGPQAALPNHQQVVDHVMQFGMIQPKVVGGVEVCVEEGRDAAAAGP